MSKFETQIEQSKKEVAEAQSKIAELSARIDTARAKMSQGTDITLDIENASLDDVHAHSDLMNANIAELIMGLDDVTAGFSKDFDGLRSRTGWEKFVGIFSKQRAESLRSERIRAATIEDKLQDLISKSNTIQAMPPVIPIAVSKTFMDQTTTITYAATPIITRFGVPTAMTPSMGELATM